MRCRRSGKAETPAPGFCCPATRARSGASLLDRQRRHRGLVGPRPRGGTRSDTRRRTGSGVITRGIARNYLRENLDDLGLGAVAPAHRRVPGAAGHLLRTLVGHVHACWCSRTASRSSSASCAALFPPTIRIMGRMRRATVPRTAS